MVRGGGEWLLECGGREHATRDSGDVTRVLWGACVAGTASVRGGGWRSASILRDPMSSEDPVDVPPQSDAPTLPPQPPPPPPPPASSTNHVVVPSDDASTDVTGPPSDQKVDERPPESSASTQTTGPLPRIPATIAEEGEERATVQSPEPTRSPIPPPSPPQPRPVTHEPQEMKHVLVRGFLRCFETILQLDGLPVRHFLVVLIPAIIIMLILRPAGPPSGMAPVRVGSSVITIGETYEEHAVFCKSAQDRMGTEGRSVCGAFWATTSGRTLFCLFSSPSGRTGRTVLFDPLDVHLGGEARDRIETDDPCPDVHQTRTRHDSALVTFAAQRPLRLRGDTAVCLQHLREVVNVGWSCAHARSTK